ncbi:MAG TPA: DUF6089 family protein [Bacteroidales bacterium]|nr:DUF6089 family protein [Bacteroidales bacterium]HQK36220.1 DUF6089 family protein [Bacteroidales bacterium]
MKKFGCIFLLLGILWTYLPAQRKADVGLFAGTAWYMGDMNPKIPFLSPGPAFGALFAYNFNPRYAVKTQVTFFQVSGKDAGSADPFRTLRNQSFSSSGFDASAVFEMNFHAFKLVDRAHPISPYINGGIGICYPVSGPASGSFIPSLPFAVGIKVGINRRTGIGIEYACRKLFSDNFDGLKNYGSEGFRNVYTNNDWYSMAGFHITYKLFDRPGDCPVYW